MKLRIALAAAAACVLLLAAVGAQLYMASNDTDSTSETGLDVSSPADETENRIREIMSEMSLRDKVWQMIMVYPENLTGSATITDLEVIADALNRCPAG
ncbi:MAG: hypothetical protein IKV47_08020, partial [Oscillospiraceae bacterium]|nr:hypothetical protein [Oscillospiraceae bacterium]